MVSSAEPSAQRRPDQGTALLIALVTVLVVTMSLLLAASLLQVRMNAAGFEERRVMTTVYADAALAETLAHLDNDPDFQGARERQFGRGRISSAVSQSGSNAFKVVAIGRLAGFQTTIEADIQILMGRPRVMRWLYRHGGG